MAEAPRVLGALPDEAIAQALSHYPGLDGARVEPILHGLINETFEVVGSAGHFVLQRLNPIFDPVIHLNIHAVTERLRRAGMSSPELVLTTEERLWVEHEEGGVWRLFTYVEGAGFDVPRAADQVRAAGELVGRFHEALEGMDHAFVGQRVGVHDTSRHLAALRQALTEHRRHRLYPQVREIGAALLARAEQLEPLPVVAEAICHGDLKFNNVRFAGAAPPLHLQPVCLIDLDTVGPMALAHELGDAWRSWCNPGGEGLGRGRFDLGLFQAAWQGYQEGRRRDLERAERQALLGGPDWISLELAARFAADALCERYFGWDAARYPAAGEHNLVRAESQWQLHLSAHHTRRERAALLGLPG